MLCLTLWEIAEDPDAFMARKAALLRVFLICLVMSLLRHNAVFAVLPAVLAVVVLCRGARKKAAALCAVTMLFCLGVPRCLQYATHAKALLSSELMSVPCQQLMRTAARADELTEEEYDEISRVVLRRNPPLSPELRRPGQGRKF